jgi:hypothetical protein
MISQKYLKSILMYNEQSGNFYWLKKLGINGQAGWLAGSVNGRYTTIFKRGKK